MGDQEGGLVRSVVRPIVAGAMGGFGSVLVGHPFETVKARLQTGVKPSWPGLRGAYAGMLSPLTGQVNASFLCSVQVLCRVPVPLLT